MHYRLYVCKIDHAPKLVEWISRVPAPPESETQLEVQYEGGQTETFSELAWSLMLLGGAVKHNSTTIKMKIQSSVQTARNEK